MFRRLEIEVEVPMQPISYSKSHTNSAVAARIVEKLSVGKKLQLLMFSPYFQGVIERFSLFDCFVLADLGVALDGQEIAKLLSNPLMGLVKHLSLSSCAAVGDAHLRVVRRNLEALKSVRLASLELSYSAVRNFLESSEIEFVELQRTLSDEEVSELVRLFPQTNFGFAALRAVDSATVQNSFPAFQLCGGSLRSYPDACLPKPETEELQFFSDQERKRLSDNNVFVGTLGRCSTPPRSIHECVFRNTFRRSCNDTLHVRTIYSNTVSPRSASLPVDKVVLCDSHLNAPNFQTLFYKCEVCRKRVTAESWAGFVCKRCQDFSHLADKRSLIKLETPTYESVSFATIVEKPVRLNQPRNFAGILESRGTVDLQPLLRAAANGNPVDSLLANRREIETSLEQLKTKIKDARNEGYSHGLLAAEADQLRLYVGTELDIHQRNLEKGFERSKALFFLFTVALVLLSAFAFSSNLWKFSVEALNVPEPALTVEKLFGISKERREFSPEAGILSSILSTSLFMVFALRAVTNYLVVVYFISIALGIYVANTILKLVFFPNSPSFPFLDSWANLNVTVFLSTALIRNSPNAAAVLAKFELVFYMLFMSAFALRSIAALLFFSVTAMVLAKYLRTSKEAIELFIELENFEEVGFELPVLRAKTVFYNCFVVVAGIAPLSAFTENPNAFSAALFSLVLVNYLYIYYLPFRKKRFPYLLACWGPLGAIYFFRHYF